MASSFVRDDILRLVQSHYKRDEATSESLDNKALQIISTSTVIIGLISAFNLAQGHIDTDHRRLFLSLLIAYGFTLFAVVITVFPVDWKGEPLKPTWAEFIRVSGKSEPEYFDWLIASYLTVIRDNGKVLRKKVVSVPFALIMVGLQVILIIILILF